MSNLQTIQEQWDGFAALVFRNTPASEVQRAEMKKAFFAGCYSMFCAIEAIGEPKVSFERAELFLENWRKDCLDFKRRLMIEYSETN